jgi:murein DD-endopeptidase MepM/ murein hydrolase activator NlpD
VTRRLSLLALAVILVVLAAAPAGGADLSSDLDRVHERISQVRSQVATAASDRSALAKRVLEAADALDAADRDVSDATAELDRVHATLAERLESLDAVRRDLTARLDELAVLRTDMDTERGQAEAWARRAYMTGGASQPSIAFNAAAVADVSVGVAYLGVLTRHSSEAADRLADLVIEEEQQTSEIRAAEQAVANEVVEIEALGASAAQLESDLVAKRDALAVALDAQEAVLDQLDDAIAHFEGELASLAKEESSIRSQIALSAAPATTTSDGSVRPVPGAISSGFGMRIHPITGTRRMHNGVDMNASQGDPIRAFRSGTVILAGVKGGYGNTVMIDHGGGMVTLYAHQSKIGVSVGTKVSAGQVVGYVGSTGDSTAPHLHFEVRLNGIPVDPTSYL